MVVPMSRGLSPHSISHDLPTDRTQPKTMRTRRTRPLTLASFPLHLHPHPSSPLLSPRPKSANRNNDFTLNRRPAPRDHCVARPSASGDIPSQSPPRTATPHLPTPTNSSRASLEYPNQCSLFINSEHHCFLVSAITTSKIRHTTSADHIPRNDTLTCP